MRIKLLAAFLLQFASNQSFGAGKATVTVTAKKDKNDVRLSFKTVPAEGLAINAEGPWKLEIKPMSGLKADKSEWKRSDWNEATGEFEFTAHPQSKATSSDVPFKLTAFICTKDKTQCFREVIEQKAPITW